MKTSEKLRKEFSEGDRIKMAGQKTPDDVIRQDNIVYDGKDPRWNLLDVYYPKGTRKPLPVIVSVHGGAWVYGNKEVYQFYCMSLARHGFTVVNFSYRLAPEYPFPASLEDVNRVMEWIFESGERYFMDTEKIFMVGDSAGGNLAALYAGICTNPEFAARYSFQVPKGFVPKAMGLNCGVYDLFMEVEEGESDTRDIMEEVFGIPDFMEKLSLINPIESVTPAYPPVFLVTAEKDFLRKQAPRLETVLKENQVPCELHLCRGTAAPLEHDFHCDMRLKEAHEINEKECEFFKGFL